MKIFTRCIAFYGGFVDKYMGDGIMALFGAKKATEHDTQRAILSALKMQEQLRLYNSLLAREPGFEHLELGLRIGINTGLVSVGKVGQSLGTIGNGKCSILSSASSIAGPEEALVCAIR